jgi:hypothetical protein
MDLRPGLTWEAAAVTPGWYACACGAVGFIEGPPELVLDLEAVKPVEECPTCV